MAVARASESGILRLYRGFLALYPAEFREEYGRELCLVFVDRWREQRSPAGLLLVWLEALAGIFHEAPKEHADMILQDLRFAVRVMRKDAVVTIAAIAILALGIGSTTLVFSLANGLLLRPLPYAQPERLVAVEEYNPKNPGEYTAACRSPTPWTLARARSFWKAWAYTAGDRPRCAGAEQPSRFLQPV
jgi:putative ABC transport system permease protein